MDGVGGVPVFGPCDPRTLNTPSQAPPPKMAILGWGWGWGQGAGVGGAPGVPSLVFLERLNGKHLADGRSPAWPQGTPARCRPPPCPRQKPLTPPPGSCALWVPGGPALMQHPGCAPLRRGEDESANRGPPLGWEAPGRGVAPGCKALAEEAREGPLASPDPTPVPQHGRA